MAKARGQLRLAEVLSLVETGRELAAETNLKSLLQTILRKASALTDSPDGSVILYDETTKGLYFAAASGKNASRLLADWGEFADRRIPIYGSKSGEVFRTGKSIVQNAIDRDSKHFKGVDRDVKKRTQSMVCVPLSVRSKPIGVMQILNKPKRYTSHDQLLLEHFAGQAAVAIRNAQLFQSLLAHMGLYASRDLNEGPMDLLKELNRPARQERMSVMFVDMRGFTQLCQMLNDPKRVQQMLNEFLSMLANTVIENEGIVNKFLGDGLLALFRRKKHERRAVESAFAMTAHFANMLSRWDEQSNLRLSFLDIGVGIVTDSVVIGTIRSGKVSDFTPIGTAVNLAAHLEHNARNGKRILVDRMTYIANKDQLAEVEGPEEFELRKSDQSMGHPYVCYHLKRLTGATDDSPEPGAIPIPATKKQGSVFISYSHKDKEWLTKLQTHLRPYERNRQVTYWDDTQIKAGQKWRDEIKRALDGARVAVLLVSPSFLASDFVANNELPPLLNAAKNNGLTILWVPLKSSSYEQTDIREYQAVMDPSQTLSKLSEPEQDEVFVRICKRIAEVVA
jgi:class 3 adenylate cyclase/putative methionine-R-sulfoxide reductase with GAF domain